jgi:hypothetical protein
VRVVILPPPSIVCINTIRRSKYDQDVTLRPPQERCMFCGQAGFVDDRMTCDDCRDGYAG